MERRSRATAPADELAIVRLGARRAEGSPMKEWGGRVYPDWEPDENCVFQGGDYPRLEKGIPPEAFLHRLEVWASHQANPNAAFFNALWLENSSYVPHYMRLLESRRGSRRSRGHGRGAKGLHRAAAPRNAAHGTARSSMVVPRLTGRQ